MRALLLILLSALGVCAQPIQRQYSTTNFWEIPLPLATIQAIAPTGTNRTVAMCSDVVTPYGITNAYIYYDGSNWRTVKENIKATTDIPTFMLNCYEAGFNGVSSKGQITYTSSIQNGNNSFTFVRTYSTANGGTTGNYGWLAVMGSAAYDRITTSAGSATWGTGFYGPAKGANRYIGQGMFVTHDAQCDATDTYWSWIGFRNGFTTTFPTDCVLFLYDRYKSVYTGTATNNWIATTGASSSYTFVDTGFPVAVTTSTVGRLYLSFTNGAALFYTNGVLAATITTTLPTVNMYVGGASIVRTAGTSNARNMIWGNLGTFNWDFDRTLP
jgi:hypothetical protein